MDNAEIKSILKEIKYKDWWFVVRDDYIQIIMGSGISGRKWRTSEFMTKSEVVQTALAGVLMCEEHEARERFFYRGKRVYGPHIDVDKLAEICDEIDVRI